MDGRAAARSGARLPAEARHAHRDRRGRSRARAEPDRHRSTITTARPLVFDRYAENRATGSFILIDPATNFTAGAGMIVQAPLRERRGPPTRGARPSGSRTAARTAATDDGRGDRGRPQGARGDAHMTAPRDARRPPSRGAASARTPCITSSFQAEMRRACTCCARSGPTSRCCSSTRSITSTQTYAYRDELAQRWDLNLVNLRAAEPAPGCGRRAPRRAARATRWSRSSRRSEATTSGSPGCAASSRRRARTCRRSSRSPAERQGDSAKDQPAGALDDAGRVGVREGARHSAAAALRARLHQHRLRAVHVAAARSANPRSGRWQGQKLECGIHIQAKKAAD